MENRKDQLLALMYHQLFTDRPRDVYSVHVDRFDEQARLLLTEGFSCVLPEEMENACSGRKVMMTFDDGYESDLILALPALKKHGFRGVSFITTGYIGTAGYMRWEQVRRLAEAGFSIQSHTHSHPLLECLTKEEVEREMALSKEIIEKKINSKVCAISLPGGSVPTGAACLAGSAGYRYVFSSMPGINPLPPAPGTVLRRVRVPPGIDAEGFLRLISGRAPGRLMTSAGHALRSGVKRMVGRKNYHRIWRSLRKQAGVIPSERAP